MVQEADKKDFGLWNFPSGNLEPYENVFSGTKREVKEETGYDVQLTGLLTIHNCIRQNNPILRLVFTGEIISERESYDTEEILQVKWIPKDEIETMGSRLKNPKSAFEILKSVQNNILFPLDIVKNIIINSESEEAK